MEKIIVKIIWFLSFFSRVIVKMFIENGWTKYILTFAYIKSSSIDNINISSSTLQNQLV